MAGLPLKKGGGPVLKNPVKQSNDRTLIIWLIFENSGLLTRLVHHLLFVMNIYIQWYISWVSFQGGDAETHLGRWWFPDDRLPHFKIGVSENGTLTINQRDFIGFNGVLLGYNIFIHNDIYVYIIQLCLNMGDFLKNTCDEPVDSAPHLWVPKPHRCCYRVDASCRLSRKSTNWTNHGH